MGDVSDLATGNYKALPGKSHEGGVHLPRAGLGTLPARCHFLEGVQPKTQKPPPPLPHPSHALRHVSSLHVRPRHLLSLGAGPHLRPFPGSLPRPPCQGGLESVSSPLTEVRYFSTPSLPRPPGPSSSPTGCRPNHVVQLFAFLCL